MNASNPSRKFRTKLAAAAASVAIAGSIGLGAVTSGTVPVLADPVKLDQPIQAPSFGDVVEVVSPAVVSVRVKGEVRETVSNMEPFGMPGMENLPENHPLRRFFDRFGESPREEFRNRRPRNERRAERPISQGSGFFISEDGYLVTNHHVIRGGSAYTVVMDDGTEIDAELVGSDERTDLAVLKVEEEREFTYVDFADDSKVRVGDWVVAVGNPFGLGGTVTAGIVSARGREIGAGVYDDFIQIDAAVNKGNSGGPAFNLSGEVVGVNTAIFSPSGGNVGIAFAIPASLAKNVVGQLIENGSIQRGWLGVQIQPVTDEIAESLGLEEAKGALINDATAGEPADKAGIRAGDVVIAVEGESIDNPKDLARTIGDMKPNSTVEVTLWRDGKAQTIDVKLGQMTEQEEVASAEPETDQPEADAAEAGFGLYLAPSEESDGLVVTDVEPGSEAEDNGILPGDVIRSVNSKEVASVKELRDAVDAASKDGRNAVLLQVVREGANRFIALPIS